MSGLHGKALKLGLLTAAILAALWTLGAQARPAKSDELSAPGDTRPILLGQSQAEADRGAVVEDVDRVPGQPDLRREAIDDARKLTEPVLEFAAVWCVGKAETGEVGRDNTVFVRQPRDKIAKHMRRAWEPVQQQERRSIRLTGFAIENLVAINHDMTIREGHCKLHGFDVERDGLRKPRRCETRV